MKQLEEAIECLEALEKTSKRNEKKEILQKAKTNPILKEFFSRAYDLEKTYGLVYKEPKNFLKMKSVFSPTLGMEEEWRLFLKLLDNLACRNLSGLNALEEVNSFLKNVPPRRAVWYIRTINRDLRIGTKVKTFGEVWPDLKSCFAVSLAEKFDSLRTEIEYPVAVEPKYDGLRITLLFKNGKGVGKTRDGKEYNEVLSHIIEELGPRIGTGAVDGEIYADWEKTGPLSVYGKKIYKSPWGKTSAMLKTGYGNGVFQEDRLSDTMRLELKRDLKFWAFDYMSMDVYNPDIAEDSTPFRARRKNLEDLISSLGEEPSTVLMPQVIVHNREDLEMAHAKNMLDSHEGSMIKVLEAPYYPKRSSVMLKWKETEFIDGVILEVLPGSGRNSEWAGSYSVRLRNGSETSCNVLGDENRKEHWENRHDLVGTVIEMTRQKDAKSVSNTARFPTFMRLRYDLPKEEV